MIEHITRGSSCLNIFVHATVVMVKETQSGLNYHLLIFDKKSTFLVNIVIVRLSITVTISAGAYGGWSSSFDRRIQILGNVLCAKNRDILRNVYCTKYKDV